MAAPSSIRMDNCLMPKVLIAGFKNLLRLCFPETRRCLKPVLMGWGAGPYAVHTMDKTSGM